MQIREAALMSRPRRLWLRFFAAVCVLLAIGLLYLAHHTRVESFYYRWYPGNTYVPARQFPDLDVKGLPKVVLVRSVGPTECFAVYYSKEFEALLEKDPSRPVKVTYRVSVRFGWPYWIETLETAGMPNVMGNTGQHGRGECF